MLVLLGLQLAGGVLFFLLMMWDDGNLLCVLSESDTDANKCE